MDYIAPLNDPFLYSIFVSDLFFSPATEIFRRSNEVVPEPGDVGNQPGSDNDKDKQGDCQRAKQVPMNPGTGP